MNVPLFTVHYSLFTLVCVLLTSCASANPYDHAMRRVRLLSNSPNVRLIPFGKSHRGRAIPAFVISDFSISSEKKARVLVCAGQHGDERNPVTSVMSLCGRLASGARPGLLRKCVLIVVPIANPDGFAACKRLNAQGVDINRDWASLRTPEARFVDGVIRTWRPHALIDAHEWMEPTPAIGNEIEVPPCALRGQASEMAALAARMEQRSGLATLRCTERTRPILLHRRYASRGYAAFLLETDRGVSYESKDRAYSSAILAATSATADQIEARAKLSPSSTRFCLSLVAPYLEPLPSDPPPLNQGFAVAFALAAGYCLLVWVMRSTPRQGNGKWSRCFRKCAVDVEIGPDFVARRHFPYPITSKSWINRRLRSRYGVRPGRRLGLAEQA